MQYRCGETLAANQNPSNVPGNGARRVPNPNFYFFSVPQDKVDDKAQNDVSSPRTLSLSRQACAPRSLRPLPYH